MGHPANFNWFVTAATSLTGGQPNLARCLAVFCAGTLYIHLAPGKIPSGGKSSCPLTELCEVQNSSCVQVLRSPILAALLYRTRAVGVSKTLRRGIFRRQGGHPVRHWAVELSSFFLFLVTCGKLSWLSVSFSAQARHFLSCGRLNAQGN